MISSLHPVSSVRNVRPWGGAPSDLHVDADGTWSGIAPAHDAPLSATEIDGRGLLALPGLLNVHAHVDKSWWGHPWQPYGGDGGTEGRIRHERARRDELGIPGLDVTRRVLEQSVRTGTTALRTHVDVDPGIGLRGIEVVREAVAEFEGALHAEIVAFPQDGVLRRDGVLDLLRSAAELGVEHIGGLDPASIDRDPVGQLDALFAIAADTGVGIDIHLHDSADLGAFQIELIIERTDRHGLAGRVNVAHGFAIAEVGAARRHDLLQAMGALDISMTTVAPLRLPQLPLHEMDAAGVRFGFGTDGIRDLWSPYGTGDLLGIAWQYARSSGIVRDDDLRRVAELATSGAASLVGRPSHELTDGAPADLVLVEAENAMDAVVRTPPRALVLGRGRVLWQA